MLYSAHLLRHLRHTIGKNIYHLRARQKMPLHKLADKSGVPVMKIDHYELGKNEVTLDHALRIACALDVPVDAIDASFSPPTFHPPLPQYQTHLKENPMSKNRHAALYRYTRLTLSRKLRLMRERNRMSMKKIAALIGMAGPKELDCNPELLDLALRVACARGVPFSELMK